MDGPLNGRLVSNALFEWLEHTGELGGTIAEQGGLSPTTVSHLLNARIEHPRLSTVRKLARHFGISVEDFVAGPKSVSARTRRNRVLESLRALSLGTRIALVEQVERREEPFSPDYAEQAAAVLEEAAEHGLTMDEVSEFVLTATAEEARDVLFYGAATEEERRRAGAAFLSATSALYRAGDLSGPEVAERLDVAKQLRIGVD
jgi:transcriptional regulator with XRE-family HTH domain